MPSKGSQHSQQGSRLAGPTRALTKSVPDVCGMDGHKPRTCMKSSGKPFCMAHKVRRRHSSKKEGRAIKALTHTEESMHTLPDTLQMTVSLYIFT